MKTSAPCTLKKAAWMKRILPLFLFIFLSGCQYFQPEAEEPVHTSAPTPSAPTATPEPLPRDGGELRLAMRTPLTLNPLLNEDVTVDRVLKLLFEPLVRLDEQQKPTSNLASLNFASDYASVTVMLREDAIWSDGMPVSADDIIFSIDFLKKAPDTVLYKDKVASIASCQFVDSKTVKITFADGVRGSAYTFMFPVIPQHYYRNETNPASAKNMTPLGNGLFLWEGYAPTKSISLSKSPYSFRQRAYIDKVSVLFILDIQTELAAFDQGLIDVISLEMTEWSKHHSVKQIRYAEYPAMYYEFIGFNFNKELLRSIDFRQGLAHALSLDDWINDVYLTHAARTLSPINPASWLYDTTLTSYAYDREAARDLIRKASGHDGIDSWVLRVLVNEENDERVKIAQHVTDSLTALGFQALLESLPFALYTERLAENDYDLFIGGYNLSLEPDLAFAFTGDNLLAFEDPELTRLLESANAIGSEDAYQRTMGMIQQHIATELPVISLAFRKSAVLTGMRVWGELKPSPDDLFANINECYIVE